MIGEYQLIPYVQNNGAWTMTDAQMGHIWDKLQANNLVPVVFDSGSVKSKVDFISLAKKSHNVANAIWGEDVLVFAWLNDIEKNHATAHFTMFPEVWGKHTKELAIINLQYWFNFKKPDGEPLLKTIIGKTPTKNKHTLNMIKGVGFTIIGEIPYVNYDAYADEFGGLTISYITREDIVNG